jgi:hypothetical protein
VLEFVALYRGRTVSEAQLVAVSAEPQLVSRFLEALLEKPQSERLSDKSEQQETTSVLGVVSED